MISPPSDPIARPHQSETVGPPPVPRPDATASVTSHARARAALRADVRLACDWLGLFLLCTRVRCRQACGCRGDPMACLRAGAPRVPAAARAFVRGMLEAQDEGLGFEEALEEVAELHDAYACWIAGL